MKESAENLDYATVMRELRAFRDQRGWRHYHTLPALARAASVEVAEVNELFLWQDDQTDFSTKKEAELKMELADTLTYLYYMCDQLNVEPNTLVHQKLMINQGRHWTFDQQKGDQ